MVVHGNWCPWSPWTNSGPWIKYYVLVGGKKDKHMVGNVDTLILITRGQYITMQSNTRILYTRWINNTLSPFFKKNNKNKTM